MTSSPGTAGGMRTRRLNVWAVLRRFRGLGAFPSIVALLSLFLLACAGDDEPPPVSRENPIIPLDTGTVFIYTDSDTIAVSVEIAETPNQRQIGLMERTELPQNEGMFFLSYEEHDSAQGFWMFRTHIPLDIAYLDRDGRIVAIRTMEPCPSPYVAGCPTYPAGVPYYGALEVNAGYFAAKGIEVGDVVRLRRGGGRQNAPADSA